MEKGGSFEDFSATLNNISRVTLYNWCDLFPEFKAAKAIAVDRALAFYRQVGLQGMLGQIKRVSKETPKTYIADNGEHKPVLDDNGQPVMIKTYAPAYFNAAVWIFMMKNRFGWRDKVEVFEEDQFEGMQFSDGEKVWDEVK